MTAAKGGPARDCDMSEKHTLVILSHWELGVGLLLKQNLDLYCLTQSLGERGRQLCFFIGKLYTGTKVYGFSLETNPGRLPSHLVGSSLHKDRWDKNTVRQDDFVSVCQILWGLLWTPDSYLLWQNFQWIELCLPGLELWAESCPEFEKHEVILLKSL